MCDLGIDYSSLRQANPDLIMISSSGFGHTDPYADYTARENTLEPMSGISYVTGYPNDGRPSPQTYIDVPVAYIAAFAIIMALRHRRRTGEDQYIDVLQYEIGIHMMPAGTNRLRGERPAHRADGQPPSVRRWSQMCHLIRPNQMVRSCAVSLPVSRPPAYGS